MIIEFENPNLMDEYFKSILDYKENDNICVDKILEKKDKYMSKLNKSRFLNDKNINDEFYYSILSELSNVILEKNDYLEILSSMNNKEYIKIDTIKTSLLANKRIPTSILFEIAYTKDFNYDSNHYYTIDELNNSINNKDIVLLDKLYNIDNIDFNNVNENEKSCLFEIINYIDFLNPNSKLYLYTLKYIRNNISEKFLDEKLNEYKNNIYREIEYVVHFDEIGDSRVISDNFVKKLYR